MGRALLTVGWVSTVGLAATGVAGYLVDGAAGLDLHLLLGLGAALLLLFSHSWIMFYLIGTGKAIREAVEAHRLDSALVQRTKGLKSRCYPAAMLAMGLAMATFILGGGVATRVLPAWVHHALFLATLAGQLRALAIEHRVLSDNRTLIREVTRLL